MSLQDRSIVRTPADLEKKYNLSKLLGLTKNIETNSQTLIKVENELNDFVINTTSSLENMETEIDGKVATWYYTGVPSLSNSPANEWTTDEERKKHIGDLYYDKSTGYCYRFQHSDTYSWENLKDNDITEAMAIANAAQDTADGKRRIFVATPTTPYDNGDLWVQGSNGEIMVCQLPRAEGEYSEGDWVVASKYTDDTVAEAIVDELGGTTTTVLGGTVTQYTKNWVKFTDLSTGGSTTISGDNITTGNIKSSNYVPGTSGMNINLDKGTLSSKNLTLSEDGTLDVGGYIKSDRGLLTNLQFMSNKNFLGQQQTNYEGIYIFVSTLDINYTIPENFEIVSAKVKLKTFKTKNSYLYAYSGEGAEDVINYGKLQNIKLYKENKSSEVINHWSYSSTNDVSEISEITGAFGTNGYTATSTEGKDVLSVDLKDANLKNFNMLLIKTSDAALNGLTREGVTEASKQTQYAYAVLDIIGYLKIT